MYPMYNGLLRYCHCWEIGTMWQAQRLPTIPNASPEMGEVESTPPKSIIGGLVLDRIPYYIYIHIYIYTIHTYHIP